MKYKVVTFVCTTLICGTTSAEIEVLDTLVLSAKSKNDSGYINQFKQETTTGSKLGLNIKETPASIEVINAKTMSQRGDSTVIRAVSKAAGIVGGSSGHGISGNYSVRGFTGYPGIDFLQDGVKLNGTIFSKRALDVANLDKIEVIRGASSILNGEGSIGATVNLITKKPNFNKAETELGIKVGSDDSYRLNFGKAGIAIEDQLAYRVDVLARRIGSDFESEKRELGALNASVLYKINDHLSTSFSIEKSKDDGEHDYQGTPLINGKLDKSVRVINYNNLIDGIDKGESLWLKNHIEWHPTQDIELKNQLYYQDASSNIRRLYYAVQDKSNPDLINRRGYDSRQKQDLIGNRFDFINHADVLGLENKFIIGLDLSQLNFHREQSTYAGKILPTSRYNPEKLYYKDFFNSTVDDYKKPDVDIKLNQLSVYLEDQLALTDDLKLVAGLRHDSYDIDYDFKKGLSSAIEQKIDKKHNEFSYRGGLVYDMDKTATLYVSYASSFESGDASASLLTVNAAQANLDLTKAKQYEIGLRKSFWKNKAEFSTSVYHITKENMFVNNPIPGAGLLNVGQQTAKGIELTLGVRPIEQLQIDANLSYTDSKYDEFIHNGIDYSRKTPSSIPKYVANIGLRYMPIADLGIGTWIKHVDSFHTDYVGFTNSVKLPSYTTVDLMFDYKLSKDLTCSFLLKNLTDEIYATTSRRDTQVFLGEARSFEFGLNYKF
ncbi:TonB-dependent siderophore receptor [Acinetobacter sp. Marseille-Q1618]|uniref:TonB-dependent receptor n=1 Tax=Acinetobacter sp. Marseille-Q1618 TaxID=2697502 RepID=UPI00156DAAB1|nr:TonB-dependent receptor [Acinetobacter sp. Marseille-Q1618]